MDDNDLPVDHGELPDLGGVDTPFEQYQDRPHNGWPSPGADHDDAVEPPDVPGPDLAGSNVSDLELSLPEELGQNAHEVTSGFDDSTSDDHLPSAAFAVGGVPDEGDVSWSAVLAPADVSAVWAAALLVEPVEGFADPRLLGAAEPVDLPLEGSV